MSLIIRPELEEDYVKVEELTREAFWNLYAPGCEEHFLCHIMRESEDFMSELDFVAELDGRIIGSIMYSRSLLVSEDGEEVPIASFGPISVHPEFQRKGIGSELIRKTRAMIEKRNMPAIVIYGDPHNYCKHGFKNGIDYKVSTMDGEYPLGLLVLELRQGFFGGRRWRARQSDVFKYDPEEAIEFDRRFVEKEKKYQYSQEIFKIHIRSFLKEERLAVTST